MKTASLLRLVTVIVLFLGIQGWIVTRTFISPRTFNSSEAYLRGAISNVHAPAPGTLQTVAVREGQHVEQGELLFVVERTTVDPETQAWREESQSVHAQQSGTITGMYAMRGTFVYGDQKLATIVDNSPDALHVMANLDVAPADVSRIRRLMSATVHADFLRGGTPIDAIISSIDPVYDPLTKTLKARLQLLSYPEEFHNMPMDLPVTVEVHEERRSDDNAVIALIHWMFPTSEAQRQ